MALVTQAFQRWLESEEGKTWSENLQYVSYSYLKAGERYGEGENCSRIYVTVSLPKACGKERAEALLEILTQAVIRYVQENMMVPSGYTGTRCTLLTQSCEIHEIEK